MKLKKNTKKKFCKGVTSLEKNTLQFLISNLKQRFYLIHNLPEKTNGAIKLLLFERLSLSNTNNELMACCVAFCSTTRWSVLAERDDCKENPNVLFLDRS